VPTQALVVVNPRSRAGATRRRFARIESLLREVLGEIEIEWTRGPRDAVRIAREGVRAGVERIVVVGGDGTTSEVAEGILGADLGGYCSVGVLPFGTGGDFARSFGPRRTLEESIRALASSESRMVDAGRVSFLGPGAQEQTLHFVNSASAGISGLTVELVNRAPKHLGGRASFFLGTLRALARYAFPPVRVVVDGKSLHEGPLTLATACNGAFFGGGMHVAPDARIDDGLLDVVLIPAYTRARLVTRLPRIYAGRHLEEEGVEHMRGSVVELAPLNDDEIWIELDGEPVGRLPVRIEVVPGALRFFGVTA
jgi:YegS/Rv2252/BmrU family lipid kinase